MKKVVVAMSGGVDSSVAAALLVEQGFDVTGMMLKLWVDECEQPDNACCTPESISQARSVAAKLRIPFYVVDAKEVFKRRVVDEFIAAYQSGQTPNPCFRCNQTIKWGFLLDTAIDNGADFLATGHYAQIREDDEGNAHLYKAVDKNKDQSYVLSGLSQSQLKHTLLQLGKLQKSEVREIARKHHLEVADKPDSQDLCFIGTNGYRDFLNRYGTQLSEPGLIKTVEGVAIGEHQGLEKFTIGQRKGILSGSAEPLYVIKKDTKSNELIVGHAEDLGNKLIQITAANWINPEPLESVSSFDIKIRYKSRPVAGSVERINDDMARINLEKPVRDATPGQIAVIYNQEEVIGSGTICVTEKE